MPAIILFLIGCVVCCAFQGDPLCVLVVSIFLIFFVALALSLLGDAGNQEIKEIKQVKYPIDYGKGNRMYR